VQNIRPRELHSFVHCYKRYSKNAYLTYLQHSLKPDNNEAWTTLHVRIENINLQLYTDFITVTKQLQCVAV
jgi:hypothetical protein